MAEYNTRPLSSKQIQEDIDSFASLKAIDGYSAQNPAYSVANGTGLKSVKEDAEEKAAQDAAAAAASRDDEIAAQWAFHDFILGAKIQIKAQFGDSSNEIQALGLKKKSEYKSPSKKPTT